MVLLTLQQSAIDSIFPGFNTGFIKGAMLLVAGLALAIIVEGSVGIPMYVAVGMMVIGGLFIILS